jgi:hypothetical protein
VTTTTRGRPPKTGASSPRSASAAESAFNRAAQNGYFDWLSHVWPAAGCTRPVRLQGTIRHIDTVTGEVLCDLDTARLPDDVIYKPCGNRRTTTCPSCAETYRRDAYQVIRAGLAGGKGIPEAVSTHPAVFATFTAPSFGLVHARVIRTHACADRAHCTCLALPCHARRDAVPCPHGHLTTCYARHAPGDPDLGQPLCADCYDYAAHVVWNNSAGELWRRTRQAAERYLNAIAHRHGWHPIRLTHGKAAEYQARGADHFHVLLRLDGIDQADPDAIIPPPAGLTAADLTDAVRHAATAVTFTTAPHPARPGGWLIGWGDQTDIRTITMTGANPVTDTMVAGYLAKYATKGTEITGHASRRITPATIDLYADPDGTHVQRLINAAWLLGEAEGWDSLTRWAHMLGFGGHFLTKARRYSITFRTLRDARALFRRLQTLADDHGPEQCQEDVDTETVLVLNGLSYVGSGWNTSGDALLANTAADMARRRRQTAREENQRVDQSPH